MCGLRLVLLPVQKPASWGGHKVSQRRKLGGLLSRPPLKLLTEDQANLVSDLRDELSNAPTGLRCSEGQLSNVNLSFYFGGMHNFTQATNVVWFQET